MSQLTAGRIREKHVSEHTALRCVDVAAEQAGVRTYINGGAALAEWAVYLIEKISSIPFRIFYIPFSLEKLFPCCRFIF